MPARTTTIPGSKKNNLLTGKAFNMFRSKFFFAVAAITLLMLIAVVVLQVMEMQEFKMF